MAIPLANDYRDADQIGDCDGMIDASLLLLQDFVDEVADLPLDALAADQPPTAFIELERYGNELTRRASELGCSPSRLDAGIVERSDELNVTADNIIGQFLITGLRSGEGGLFSG